MMRLVAKAGRWWKSGLRVRMGRGWTRLALAAVALAALVPLAILATGAPGSASLAAALADPLSVLAARSPGARAPGALAQSKAVKAADMQERVLSDLRERPAAPGAPVAGVGPGTPAVPLVGDVAPAAAPGQVAAFGDGPAAFVGPGSILPGAIYAPGLGAGGGGVGGGGAGGGGVGGGGGAGGGTGTTPGNGTGTTPGGGPSVTPDTPVPAIPEPGTWLSLLIGFGALGAVLRRRPAAVHGEAPARPRD